MVDPYEVELGGLQVKGSRCSQCGDKGCEIYISNDPEGERLCLMICVLRYDHFLFYTYTQTL